MNIENIMNTNPVLIGKYERVSKALSLMKKYNINNIPVIDKKKYVGIISLKDIIRNINPEITKVETYTKKVPKLSKNDDMKKAATLLLNSEITSLPVIEKNKIIGVVSEIDLLKKININAPVGQFATKFISVNKNATIGYVKKLMETHNISRVPIVDNEDILGIVDLFGMIKYVEAINEYEAKGRVTTGGAGKKIKKTDINATNFMRGFIEISGNKKLNEVLPLFEKSEDIIIDGKSIIIPKDILELFVSKNIFENSDHLIEKQKNIEEKTIIQTSNLELNDEIDKSMVIEKLRMFAEKYEKKFKGPKYLFMHLETVNKGGKSRYEIRIRYSTEKRMFVSRSYGWNVISVTNDALRKMEKIIR